MELPAVEHKFKCPECPHDTFRKSNFVHHAKTAHLKDYEIVYRCIGCQKDFDQIRDCLAHTTSCQSIQKVVDTREEKGLFVALIIMSIPCFLEKRKIRPPQDPYILELSKIQSLTTTAKKSVQLDSGETNDKQPADIEEVSTRATSSSDRDEQISGISSISRKRGVDDGSNEFLIKVPRRDDSFSCPDCNKRFDRQDRVSSIFVDRSLPPTFIEYTSIHFRPLNTSKQNTRETFLLLLSACTVTKDLMYCETPPSMQSGRE